MLDCSKNYSYYYNDTEPRTHSDNLLEVAYVGITVFLSILGLCFNACAVTIIIKGSKFGKSIRIQLINMAVADILCSLAAIVSGISDSLEGLPVSYVVQFQKAQQFTMPVLYIASLLSNTVISMERFVAVYFPLKMREYRRRHVITVIVIIWVLSVVVNLQLLLKKDAIVYHPVNIRLACTLKRKPPLSVVRVASYVIVICLPVVIIVTCYTLIGVKLARRTVIGVKRGNRQSSVNTQVRELIDY